MPFNGKALALLLRNVFAPTAAEYESVVFVTPAGQRFQVQDAGIEAAADLMTADTIVLYGYARQEGATGCVSMRASAVRRAEAVDSGRQARERNLKREAPTLWPGYSDWWLIGYDAEDLAQRQCDLCDQEEGQSSGRSSVVCSCGNLIDFGVLRPGPGTREVREHPACGRKPNRIVPMGRTP